MVAGMVATQRASTAQVLKRSEQRAVADERDEALDQAEALGDERDGARRGLAAGARQLVVELGVLEVPQVEAQGLLEDGDVDVDAQAQAQDTADQAEPPLHERQDDDEPQLDQHPVQRRVTVVGDDGVDDRLSGVGHPEGHQAADERQHRQSDRLRRRRPPHEPQRHPRVGKALAQLRQDAALGRDRSLGKGTHYAARRSFCGNPNSAVAPASPTSITRSQYRVPTQTGGTSPKGTRSRTISTLDTRRLTTGIA